MHILFLLLLFFFAESLQQNYSLQLQPKSSYHCMTPNYGWGVCIQIRRCKVFIDSLTNDQKDNHEFIRASRCGPRNEDSPNVLVCCGEHANYIHKVTMTTPRPHEKKKHNNPLPKQCGNHTITLPSRIMGGTKTSIGEFPWMARLRHKSSDGITTYGCAGFLIAHDFVLTAAHCVDSKALQPLGSIFQVQLGEHNTYTNPDCEGFPQNRRCADTPQLLDTETPIVHHEYVDNIHQHNDIALIPLKNPATFTEFVAPICLAKKESAQTDMWLSGWGKTETHLSSHIKLKVELTRANRDDCALKYSLYQAKIMQTQLCAGGVAGRDSCTGDSGGPLMVQNDPVTWEAEGIVSYGLGCGVENWPGVYTNIPQYLPWIKRKMNHHRRQKSQYSGGGGGTKNSYHSVKY